MDDDNLENSLWVYDSSSTSSAIYIIKEKVDRGEVLMHQCSRILNDSIDTKLFTHSLDSVKSLLRMVRNVSDPILNKPKILLAQLKSAGVTQEIYSLLVELEL